VVLEVPLAEHLPKRGTFAVAHDSCAEGTMKSLVLVALLVAASGSYADPKREAAFGFWKGMTLKEAKAAAPLEKAPNAPSFYATRNPPQPVYPFSVYMVGIGPSAGVCAVVAQTDHMLKGSKAFLDTAGTVLQMLSDRYGNPTHSSDTQTSKTVKWQNAQGPNTAVQMAVHYADDGSVYIQAGYRFSNLQHCNKEILEGL